MLTPLVGALLLFIVGAIGGAVTCFLYIVGGGAEVEASELKPSYPDYLTELLNQEVSVLYGKDVVAEGILTDIDGPFAILASNDDDVFYDEMLIPLHGDYWFYRSYGGESEQQGEGGA